MVNRLARSILVVLTLPMILIGQTVSEAPWNINELAAAAKALGAADLPDVRVRAEAGDARAQFLLGLAYEYAYAGLTKDVAEALRWDKMAARQGIGLAETWVGDFYYDGLGVAVDHAEALSWYRRGSEHGYPSATRYVADFHLFGLGTARDPAEAAVWYAKGASQGDARSRVRLSLLTPPCEDDFCAALRTLIISRDNSFRDLKGTSRVEPPKEVFAGTLKPAGASACEVTPADAVRQAGAEYECVFAMPWEKLEEKVRAALPGGWLSEVQGLGILYAGPDDFDLAVILNGPALKIVAPYREP